MGRDAEQLPQSRPQSPPSAALLLHSRESRCIYSCTCRHSSPTHPLMLLLLLHSAVAAGGSYAEQGDCSAKYAKQCSSSGKVGKIPLEEKILPNCEAWHSPLLLFHLVLANGCTRLIIWNTRKVSALRQGKNVVCENGLYHNGSLTF